MNFAYICSINVNVIFVNSLSIYLGYFNVLQYFRRHMEALSYQARSQAYSRTRASTSTSKTEKNKWPKNAIKIGP